MNGCLAVIAAVHPHSEQRQVLDGLPLLMSLCAMWIELAEAAYTPQAIVATVLARMRYSVVI